MTVTCCINVFNEAGNIRAAMESIAPYVDRFVVVDGAYAAFPMHGNNGASDDGTLETVKQLQKEWAKEIVLVESNGPWENEMVKRSTYYRHVPNFEWLFVLDGDERIVGGGNFIAQAEAYRETRQFDLGICVIHFSGPDDHYGTVGRLYRKKPGMRCGQGHSHIIYDGGHLWHELFTPIVIEHTWNSRPKARDEARQGFYSSGAMK